MAKFVELERPSGVAFFVNADYVELITKSQYEKQSTIKIGGNKEDVKGTPAEVVKKLTAEPSAPPPA